MRLFPVSATYTLPDKSVATPTGPLNWPLPLPVEPQVVMNPPLVVYLNTASPLTTYTLPGTSTATPLGSETAQLVISVPVFENLRTRLLPLSATSTLLEGSSARPFGARSVPDPQDVMSVPLELYLAMILLGVTETKTSPGPASTAIPEV